MFFWCCTPNHIDLDQAKTKALRKARPGWRPNQSETIFKAIPAIRKMPFFAANLKNIATFKLEKVVLSKNLVETETRPRLRNYDLRLRSIRSSYLQRSLGWEKQYNLDKFASLFPVPAVNRWLYEYSLFEETLNSVLINNTKLFGLSL